MSISSEVTRLGNAKTAIASAIANKGVTVPSGTKLDGMATLIGQIEGGGGNYQSKSVTYTSNGTATVTPDAGYDGLSSVDVTVDVAGSGGGSSIVNEINLQGINFDIELDNVSCSDWAIKYGDVFISTPNATPSLTFTNCLFEACHIYCRQAVQDAIVNGDNNFIIDCQWN